MEESTESLHIFSLTPQAPEGSSTEAEISQDVLDFYRAQGGTNQWIEVRSTCNIANLNGSNGQRGCF